MEVTPSYFETEEVVAGAKVLGLHAITVDVPVDYNEPRWHDVDAMIYR
jgi:hypothetical protein